MTRRNAGLYRKGSWGLTLAAGTARSVLSIVIACGLVTALVLPSAVLVACEKKKPPPPPPPAPPPPPPPPEPVQISPIMQSAKPDARVHFPQAHAPTDESLARAVISLADAVAKGDASKLGSMVDADTRTTLDYLTGSGEWDEATAKIEGVRVVHIEDLSDGGQQSTLANVNIAVQEPGSAYLMGWTALKAGDKWTFRQAPSDNGTRGRASEFDGGEPDAAPSETAAPAPTQPLGDTTSPPTSGRAQPSPGGGPGQAAPAATGTQPTSLEASTGRVKGHRPLELHLNYEMTLRILQRSKAGPPLPTELHMAMCRRYDIDGLTLSKELEIGTAEASQGRHLPPLELAIYVDEQVKRYNASIDVDTDFILKMIAGLSSRTFEEVGKEYDEGVKLKKK